MFQTLLEGLLLGLSLGSTCLVTCLPIYLPYIVSEDNNLKKSFLKVMEISAGRFVPYLLFGALAGLLGSFIPSRDRILFTGISYVLLSVFLILNSIRTHKEGKSCAVSGIMKMTKSPFLLGVVTGISFCPTFLLALAKSVDLGGVFSGVILFLGFFFGTTVYLIPLALGGLLTTISKVKLAARYISIVIAVWFIIQGGFNIYNSFLEEQKQMANPLETGAKYVGSVLASPYRAYQDRQKQMLNPVESTLKPVILMPMADSLYARALADSLAEVYTTPAKVQLADKFIPADYASYPSDAVLYIDGDLWQASYETVLEKQSYVIMQPDYPISEMNAFLGGCIFKVKKGTGFHWTFDTRFHKHK